MRRRTLLAAPALLLPRPGSAAAPWPLDRPIEAICPFPAGGGVDVMTRLVLPLAAERLPGARFIVNNRAGAAGQLGLEATFLAAPDGYTIGATTFPAHSAIPLERPARYRPLEFTFLANVVEDPNAIYVRAESPLADLGALLREARANPGGLDYGTTGIGSDDHIMMLELEARAGLPPLTHVPFAGSAPLIPQLLGGHIALAVGNVSETVALSREGKVRVLGVAAAQRVAEAPDAPTFAEQGFPLVASAQRGLLAPPGLPEPIRAALVDALRAAVTDPRFIREATRQAWPLHPVLGADYLAMATEADAALAALWRRRPWRG